MRRSPDETIPVWSEAERDRPAFPTLRQDTDADVCVIGAGIAGLTTAYLLQKEGKSVVVLDAYGLAAGETGRTTAHLSGVLDDRFSHLESLFGAAGARLAADSHRAAIDRIESIVREEQIDCDFERVTGYLVAMDDQQRRALDNEFAAVPRAGFYEAEGFPEVPLAGVVDTGPGLMFPQQATFHPTKYISGLAGAFEKLGGRIYVGAHVRSVTGGPGASIETDDGRRVSARHIVVATNTPINDRVTMHTKQAAYRSYAVAFDIPKNSYPGFLLWDLEDPYHYVRLMRAGDQDRLIVGGEDHKTGQAGDMAVRYRRIEEWTRRHFAAVGEVAYRWSGQIMEPVDSLAFIGRNPGDDDNVYIATGDSGHGMTHGTIAGMLITDLIQKRDNPWAAIYEPSRKTPRSVTSFLSENLNVAARMLKDWVKPSEVDNLGRGEGAVLRRGASKIAVYRDRSGALHGLSAVCTHLGCIVQWNPNEKSWDCPCHGSRYDIEGRVLNGPAVSRLSPAEIGLAGDGQRDQRNRADDDAVPGEHAKTVPADEVH